ncbi:MAG: hypothetical protein QHC78_12590 [Pigmentiphaga sp.]|uniref:hypothetical protein n=1 Tax=Pigmentiphaga sp. TaxID=1977564 RepID=UPI0029AEA4A6|nr:hypothetical protein [Pigmentiphaga sp.]MDX3906519.1 hypothetical protein [Pigmentiphaga sp.]
MHKLTIALGAALLFTTAHIAQAQEEIVSCAALGSAELNKLEKVYSLGDIRVFYTQQAPASGTDHRLPPLSQVDGNGNGVPDYVENVAKQADVSRKLYNALGFRDPLGSSKYRAVKTIDINLLNISANALAYDGAVYYPSAPGRGPNCTLRVDVSSNLELSGTFTTQWFVVGHEMFHLFQYGQTLFKRGWVNEPTAKWAEYASRPGPFYPLGSPSYTLPSTLPDFQATVVAASTSQNANRFWSRLIDLVESEDGSLRIPAHLLSEQYTDGIAVIKDQTLRGAALISAIYQTLDAEDDIVSHLNGWNSYNWAESDQTSSSHDPRILAAVQRAIRRTGTSNPELNAFLDIE